MRILHLNAKADCGGVEVMIRGFLERSAARGDVTAVAMADGPWRGAFTAAGASWHELPLVERSPLRLPALVRAIRRAVREVRPDVIHAHNPTMMLGAALASGGRRGIRLVGTLHGNASGEYGREAAIARVFPGTVTAVTPFIAGELHRHGARATTITSGVPPLPAAAGRAELEDLLGVPAGVPLVVGVGRLHPMKRWHLAIDAMREVPGAVLVIFGEGPERGALERRIREAGLVDRVLLPGVVPDVREFAGAADVGLVTSAGEGFSLAVLELLSAGVPLVAADVPGISDIVDGDSALMIDPEDATATASAIRAALAGGPGTAARVARGRDIARANSLERMNDRYFALYDGAGAGGDDRGVDHDGGRGGAAAVAGPRPGRFHDRRWDGVVTMRAVVPPPGRTGPGADGDAAGAAGRERIAAAIRRSFPGIPVAFARVRPTRDRGEAFGDVHELLDARGWSADDGVLVCDAGGVVVLAHSHALGDFTTCRAAFAPAEAVLAGTADPGIPVPPPARRPIPAILGALLRRGLREPRATAAAARAALADDRAGRAGAPEGPGAPRRAEGRPRYLTLELTGPGDGRRPRAAALAWDWRAALAAELGPAFPHPRDAWLIVGLRRGNPTLEGRGGNFLARIRMAWTGDRAADVAATAARIRSPLPLARTALSAVPQQLRQLAGPGGAAPRRPGFPARRTVAVEGLATSWAHNRVDEPVPGEATVAVVGPGVVSVNLYEGAAATVLTVSALVDDATWDGVVRATRRAMAEAGYRDAGACATRDDAGGDGVPRPARPAPEVEG